MSNYDADSIPLIDAMEHVRKRPGMYIGGTDQRALNHISYILIDSAVEEAFIGNCNQIEVTLEKSGALKITDNSNGLPLEIDARHGLSYAELLMTRVGYYKDGYDPTRYEIVGGLHGLGLAPINALSEKLSLEIRNDGLLWQQEYQQGKSLTPLRKIRALNPDESSGNTFTLKPDFTIFKPTDFDFDSISTRCREVAYQVAGLRVICRDKRHDPPKEVEYLAEDGLLSMLHDLRGHHSPLHEAVYRTNNVEVAHEKYGTFKIGIDFVFQFTDAAQTIMRGYVNTVFTPQDGTHVDGLKSGLRKYFRVILEPRYGWQDIAPGLIGIISIRHPDPQFISPTKAILGNEDIFHPARALVIEAAKEAGLDKNPELMKRINATFIKRVGTNES